MIVIAGNTVQPDSIGEYAPGSIERTILDMLASSSAKSAYDSVDQLKFELALRKEIIAASLQLYRSGLGFEIFRETRCNPDYWKRTQEGGFLLKDGVKPSKAIMDIYENGSKYGTECATAMMIVYYKALLSVYGEALFDKTFPKIELMNWHHIDPLLREVGYISKRDVYLPGDRRYFANPDVDPLVPQWQGENVIDLGDGKYYGHGIGIRNADQIIRALNQNRSEDADEDAHLLDSAGRPNFNRLYGISRRSAA
ncbi:protein-glutamine gamma-glutamyltransferase [Caproiciproducens sp. CPB-2]|uniref:protein-glutamine gamma-glutamyltransferase n=1 Tax=Caproiciproducens sp. CPB-2 TaxID=3030017 RepID=UPI0023DB6F0F|nr:protein-glutamine gamma-glutamyltransferase [Caproiciproducens sp. CPB-2]MDF1493475.1 protein-glutamine gamma-glutamyltransferase [Caproiciproducens sp. CPB-2]